MLRNEIAIDLGTSYTLVYIKGKGIVLREPTIVAIDIEKEELIAVGKKAEDMIGKTPESIKVIRPLKDGVISDYIITEKYLKNILKRVCKKMLISPKMMVCIPSKVTQVEKKALIDVVMQAGASEVYLIEEPKAAAIGAGIDIYKPVGSMVIDIGGGTTDIAVLSLGDVVSSKSIKVGGNRFDEMIIRYIKKKYELLIGEKLAEEIKNTIGTLVIKETDEVLSINGRDLKTGLPKDITITSNETIYPIHNAMEEIVYTVEELLEEIKPELVTDITENSIILTGGGSLINGMDRYLTELLGIKVILADNTDSCVAIGTGKALSEMESYNQYKQAYRKEK